MNQEKQNFSSLKPERLVESEREMVWKKKMAEVNKITDSLGKGIDEKIKESVCAFLVHGFTTSASCEGHLAKEGEEEHGHPYPWVEIYAPKPEGLEEAKGEEKDRLEQEWRIKNFEQQRKMMKLLEEFYQNREAPFDARLVFANIGAFGGFRVQSFGAEIMAILPLKEKQEKLALYRKEMRDFTEFLKRKFFEGK
jgi:hypothetical protein